MRSGRDESESKVGGRSRMGNLWAGGHLNEMYVRDVKCDRGRVDCGWRQRAYLGLKGI